MFKKFSVEKKIKAEVEDLSPRKFESELQKRALGFERNYNQTSKGFKMDRVMLNKAGIVNIHEKRIERRVKEVVEVELEKIRKEAQELGYSSGFETGEKAGHEKALEEQKIRYQKDIENQKIILGNLDSKISLAYDQIVASNQKNFFDLLKLCVEKLVYKNVGINKEAIEKIIEEQFGSIRDVQINVKINQFDYSALRSDLFEEFQLKKIIIEVDPNLNRGDIEIESKDLNIEYTLVESFAKLWKELENDIS